MLVLNEYYEKVAGYVFDAVQLLDNQKLNGKDDIMAEYDSMPRVFLTPFFECFLCLRFIDNFIHFIGEISFCVSVITCHIFNVIRSATACTAKLPGLTVKTYRLRN
jgi:hypothetical protein